MSLKNKKIFVVLTLLLISLFSISCNENKLKLNAEELKNCARWNWIALTDTKKWTNQIKKIAEEILNGNKNYEISKSYHFQCKVYFLRFLHPLA